mmetsp:Transcript_15463/g.43282  ORF Transcript_15463/g.43282 Transcript_15463/m.43282 type:complete len:201 (+) Transcript_15463:1086-1688(+)
MGGVKHVQEGSPELVNQLGRLVLVPLLSGLHGEAHKVAAAGLRVGGQVLQRALQELQRLVEVGDDEEVVEGFATEEGPQLLPVRALLLSLSQLGDGLPASRLAALLAQRHHAVNLPQGGVQAPVVARGDDAVGQHEDADPGDPGRGSVEGAEHAAREGAPNRERHRQLEHVEAGEVLGVVRHACSPPSLCLSPPQLSWNL